MSGETPAELITEAGGLRELCAALRGAPFIALDTEFVRVRTYYARLCLIQVATPAYCACIDPLADFPIEPLIELLHEPATTKVMHAARQDLELFHQLDGRLPGPLFDTQIAAALLGHDEQIGYARLVEQQLGVVLDKAHTRTDWSERPLSAQQLHYAAEDVRHLATLYQQLSDRLRARGRLTWALDDARSLLDPALYRIVPGDAWERVKGYTQLRSARQRAALERLAAWREEEAMRRNLPRQWVLRDAPLLALAQRLPASRERLTQVPDLPQAVLERYGRALLELVNQEPAAGAGARLPLEAQNAEHLETLMALLRERASTHEISPSVLAPRRELAQLLRGERDLGLLKGWRYEVAGRELLALAERLGT